MIQRKKPLRRGGPIKRYTPVKRVSERRRAALYEYGKKRKKFLRARPICECCNKTASRDVHHVNGRLGSCYLDENTWLAVCRTCHDWIHQHPSESRAKGLLK